MVANEFSIVAICTVINNQEGRKSMLKLSERMVMSFCSGVSASTTHTWTTLSGSGAEDVRVMTRKSVDDPGRPPGIVLNAATSFWLPVPPKRVFDFLRDENSRNEVRNAQSCIHDRFSYCIKFMEVQVFKFHILSCTYVRDSI